jgi:hypothetical protein
LLEISSYEVYERMNSSFYFSHMGKGGWENVLENEVSNTYQLVMIPSKNELYHSRASP